MSSATARDDITVSFYLHYAKIQKAVDLHIFRDFNPKLYNTHNGSPGPFIVDPLFHQFIPLVHFFPKMEINM